MRADAPIFVPQCLRSGQPTMVPAPVPKRWTAGALRSSLGLDDPRKGTILSRLDPPIREQLMRLQAAADDQVVVALKVFTDGSASMTRTWPIAVATADWGCFCCSEDV